MSSDKKFEWTEDLAIEFAKYYKREITKPENWGKDILPAFKASHSIDVGRDGWEIVAINEKGRIIENDSAIFMAAFKCNFPIAIHSVLRLSDNTTWTVGDIVGFLQKPITRFSIRESDGVMWVNGLGFGVPLSGLSKLPPERSKLFTTSDGKDIYVGDKVFYIGHEWEIVNWTVEGDWDLPDPSTQTFSTRDKAIEYVTLNKPCLSVNDVINIYGIWRDNDGLFEDWVKRLSKSKIKL